MITLLTNYVFILSRENKNLLSMRSVHKNIKSLKGVKSNKWTTLSKIVKVFTNRSCFVVSLKLQSCSFLRMKLFLLMLFK